MSRLEEIKESAGVGAGMAMIKLEEFEWLVSRVDELEQEKYQDTRQGMLEDLHMENERLKKRVKTLEKEINTHAPEGRNYTNKQYVDLLHENQRYKQALEEIRQATSHNKIWKLIAIEALEVNK